MIFHSSRPGALTSRKSRPLVRGALSAAGLFAGFLAAAGAQPARPVVQGPDHHDLSQPLREIPPASRPSGPPHEAFEPGRLPPPQATGAADPVTQTWKGRLAIPSTDRDFEGIGDGFTGPQGTFGVNSAPPDTNGDVGPSHYVQIVNTDFAVFDRAGNVLYGPVPSNTLWSGFGGGCQTNNDGDAVVKYDRRADRWVFTQFSVSTTPFKECLAVSTSGDPTGSYNRYAYTFSNFPDYPKLAVWPDAYYITYNMFNGNTFLGGEICAYDRTTMLVGGAATQQCFGPSSNMGGSLPSDVDGSANPPGGSPNYVVNFGTNSLQLWKLHVDWGNSALSSLTGPTVVAVASFSAACGGGTCIPQPGTSNKLDSLADRLMFRLAYRNLGDHESLVVNHSVTPSGTGVGVSGVRWYEIRSPGSSPTIFQQGTFAPADGGSRWMGSIAMDGSGDIAMGYSVSSGSVFPSIRYTGRLASDPAGTMPHGEGSIQAGAGSQTKLLGQTLHRWGDYSSISVDPVDDCTFWYTNQYQATTGAFNWHTRIGSFRFPSCGCAPPAAPVASNNGPICAGGTLQLSATGPAGSYNWTGPNGFTSNQQNPQILSAPASASGTYSVTVTVGGCTSSPSTTSALVRALPSASIAAASAICPGSPGIASVPSAGAGATYAWTIGNGTITSGQGTAGISYTAGSSGNISLGVAVTDANGCAANGSRNVSISLAACSGRVFSTVTPCRVLDTRNPDGPFGGPALAAGGSRTFAIAGQCGIPSNALSVAVNVTVTAPTSGGFVTVYPGGSPVPPTSTINYSAGQTRANNAVISLGPSGDITAACGQPSGTVQFILDVTGYFQ